MGNLIQNNISFTVNTDEPIGGFGTKRSNSNIISFDDKLGHYNSNEKQSLINANNESPNGFSINAIDIDLNNAELPNASVDTGSSKIFKNVGELLKLINDIQQEIYILTDIIFNKIENNNSENSNAPSGDDPGDISFDDPTGEQGNTGSQSTGEQGNNENEEQNKYEIIMKPITQNSTNFSINENEPMGGFATKRTNSNIIITSGKNNYNYNIEKKQDLINANNESRGGGFSINAIDIDLNNAVLPNASVDTGSSKTFKNAGELLKLINDIQQEIYILTDIIFDKKLKDDVYWYVGTVNPTNPSNPEENKGIINWDEDKQTGTGYCLWEKVSSKPSELPIETKNVRPSSIWYVAMPNAWGFQAYETTGIIPDAMAFNKYSNKLTVKGIQYDIFLSTSKRLKVNSIFKQ